MQVEPDDLGEIKQLHEVQPPLALLDVRDERSMASLSHGGLVPLRDQHPSEYVVSRGVEGLRHLSGERS